MVHAGCVFAAGIHPSRTWMSGSFESVRWNACVHRLHLSLHSHSEEFWGKGVRTHVNSKGERRGSEQVEPATRHQAGQWTHTLPTELVRPPSVDHIHCIIYTRLTQTNSQSKFGIVETNSLSTSCLLFHLLFQPLLRLVCRLLLPPPCYWC